MASKVFISSLATVTLTLLLLVQVPSSVSTLTDVAGWEFACSDDTKSYTFIEKNHPCRAGQWTGDSWSHRGPPDRSRGAGLDDAAIRGDNLPKLLRFLLQNRYERKLSESLAEEKPFQLDGSKITVYSKNGLASILDNISSSSLHSGREEPELSWTPQQNNLQDVMPAKRARDNMFGAMPPLNELCRMMKVQCY